MEVLTELYVIIVMAFYLLILAIILFALLYVILNAVKRYIYRNWKKYSDINNVIHTRDDGRRKR